MVKLGKNRRQNQCLLIHLGCLCWGLVLSMAGYEETIDNFREWSRLFAIFGAPCRLKISVSSGSGYNRWKFEPFQSLFDCSSPFLGFHDMENMRRQWCGNQNIKNLALSEQALSVIRCRRTITSLNISVSYIYKLCMLLFSGFPGASWPPKVGTLIWPWVNP